MTSPYSAARAGIPGASATASRDGDTTRLAPPAADAESMRSTPRARGDMPVEGGLAGPARDTGSRPGSPGRRLLRTEEWAHAERALNLSGREMEIAQAIFDDRTESLIARELGISPHTVHTHVERLYRKLAVASRTQLVLRITETATGRDRM